MSNLSQKQLAVASAAILFVYWVMVFSLPFLIHSRESRSSAPLSFWCVICLAIVYFSYTGIRAWRRRWKARFVLRIVVPTALLVTSTMLVVLSGW